MSFSMITSCFFSVDSFFLLSGLLNSYIFMKEIVDKKKKLSGGFWLKYYLHRIWRITPPYMLVLMFNVALSRYIGTGPFFPKNGFETDFCRNTWWTNLLYVNNLVNTDTPVSKLEIDLY